MASYIVRTLGSNGDQQLWTLSWWAKFGDQASTYGGAMINCSDGATGTACFTIYPKSNSTHWGHFDFYNDPGGTKNFYTTARYRDPSAWYHFVVAYDTAQATEANRVKIYVNGSQVTSFHTAQYPAQNYSDGGVGRNGYNMTLGAHNSGSSTSWDYEGYLAHFHYCDGYAYAASDFGETDSDSGIWKPKIAPSVSYGNQGCFLKFKNEGTSAATGNVGEDYSGNDNHFTAANMGTYYVTTDTPNNNFSTWNTAVAMNTTMTMKNGLLKGLTGSNYASGKSNTWFSTLGMSTGKWYAEFKLTTASSANDGGLVGVAHTLADHTNGTVSNFAGTSSQTAKGWGYQLNGNRYNGGATSGHATYTTNDIISVAVDCTNNKIWWAKNGTWQGSGDPAGGTNQGYTLTADKTYFFAASDTSSANTFTYEANFGNPTWTVSSAQADDAGYGKFEYDVPTGFYALCTNNINAYG